MLWKKLRALEQIQRWNHHPSVREQNVAAHSFNVTVITAILAEVVLKMDEAPASELIRQALWHDFSESVTGDVSPLVKRYADWDTVEARANIEAARIFPALSGKARLILSSRMHPVVKMADYLDAWLFSHTEVSLGNQMHLEIRDELTKKIQALVPEVMKAVEVTRGNVGEEELFDDLKGLFDYDFKNARTKDLPEGMSHV